MAAWIALFILALGAMFLLADTGGTIAGVDSTTFGYVVFCVAILIYLTGGMLSSSPCTPIAIPCFRSPDASPASSFPVVP
jgi:hypothetical protein